MTTSLLITLIVTIGLIVLVYLYKIKKMINSENLSLKKSSPKAHKSILECIIPCKKYTINGKTISKPHSKAIIPTLLVIAFFIFCLYFIPTKNISIKFNQMFILIERMFSPSTGKTHTWSGWFSYMWELRKPLLETLKMTFLGTLFGSIVCIPFAILSARNIVKSPFIYQPARLIMNFVRTIPTLVLAVIAMFFFGLGPLPGVISLAIFSFGIMTKMVYEIIETLDMDPYEALESTGATKLQAFIKAIVPQILPVFVGYFIYTFEINVRGSVILGYVGAGGIGVELDNAMSNMYYDRVGAIVVVLFFLVLIVQAFTNFVRGKLQ